MIRDFAAKQIAREILTPCLKEVSEELVGLAASLIVLAVRADEMRQQIEGQKIADKVAGQVMEGPLLRSMGKPMETE